LFPIILVSPNYFSSFRYFFGVAFKINSLMVVSDISCDIQGSIEFLERSTSIDRPCYQYDPIAGSESSDTIGDFGVTVFGVDILPSELPVESSQHFGTALKQVLHDIVNARTNFQEEKGGGNDTVSIIDATKLSSPLSRALITTKDGALTDDYKYLAPIMEHVPKQISAADVQSMILALEGHLFDSNLINHVLDILEMNDCDCAFKECDVQYRPKGEAPIKSNVVLKITGDKTVDMAMVRNKIKALVEAMIPAEATMRWMDSGPNGSDRRESTAVVESQNVNKRVLLLGSGRVSMSVVDWLGRSTGRDIVVASNNDDEAKAVASLAQNGNSSHVTMDVANDNEGLARLVNQSDLVISLLPAMMHPKVSPQKVDSFRRFDEVFLFLIFDIFNRLNCIIGCSNVYRC
jgi:alpha-aminoadipic semialdehyde synthase